MMTGTICFFLCSTRLVSFYRQQYGSFSYSPSRRRRLLYVTSNTVEKEIGINRCFLISSLSCSLFLLLVFLAFFSLQQRKDR